MRYRRYRQYNPDLRKCPYCGSKQLIKSGICNFAKDGDKPRLKQRWACKVCDKTTCYPKKVKSQ